MERELKGAPAGAGSEGPDSGPLGLTSRLMVSVAVLCVPRRKDLDGAPGHTTLGVGESRMSADRTQFFA